MRPAMGARNTDSRHVLVVGGAGYVGNVLVRRLLAEGYRVRVLDRLLFDHGSALSGLFEEPGFEFVRGDLTEAADVERSLDGVTDVVLLAALVGDPICRKYPELAHRVNDEGAKRLFDALIGRGIDRFAFTSTCSNYGLRGTDDPATEESELAPLSLYAETKVEFERYVLSREADWDLCPTLLRIATAYGLSPRMRFDLTISEFTRTLTIGQELVVYDADTWRPYCHVRDIAAAIMTVLAAPKDAVRGEVFNVGHAEGNYTKRMVVDAVQEYLGGSGSVRFTEGGQDPRNYRVSFDKIREQLGFEPQHTVPETVGTLIEAIRAGAFNDVEARPTFYTNNTAIADDEAAVHEEAGGSD
jgi:nucleoside-diphosphate-sugar epimerase